MQKPDSLISALNFHVHGECEVREVESERLYFEIIFHAPSECEWSRTFCPRRVFWFTSGKQTDSDVPGGVAIVTQQCRFSEELVICGGRGCALSERPAVHKHAHIRALNTRSTTHTFTFKHRDARAYTPLVVNAQTQTYAHICIHIQTYVHI